MPKRWAGIQVYGYAFTFDDGGKSSNSQFLGSVEAVVLMVDRKFELKIELFILRELGREWRCLMGGVSVAL